MPAVEFRKVTKKYGASTVLENLNLKIDNGEFVVLLGPSGCGKTTLLNILAGLLDVDDGEIYVGEREVSQLDPKDRGLAMVFQSYALYPTKSVRGNLKFGLSARKLSSDQIKQRIDWAAKLLQIDHLLDRKPSQLSGGQRQRVAIGRCLVKQVDLFLFDEPLSNLDAKLRTEMRIEIKKLHNQLQNTVIYVTHDQVEAMTMATKIAVMNKGIIQQVGTPDEIYDFPENLFVADFVGSPSMNMLDCVIDRTNGPVIAIDRPDDLAFELDNYKWRQAATNGQKVKVGFRPEHFLQPNGMQPPGKYLRLERRAQLFEKSGRDAIAFLDLPSRTIAARVDPAYADRYRHEKSVPVLLPLNRLNVFDAESGQRL
jgi:multiple sugar transport system ATP-binding protein